MNGIVIIFLAIVFSAFFSGMEIAYITSNKLRIELDRKQGAFGSDILKFFTNNPGQYLATMLIGNNIAIVVYGLVFSNLLGPPLASIFDSDALVLILNTFLSTIVLLFFAEFLPKKVFIQYPNFLLKFFSLPTLFFFFIFYPVSKFTLAASNLFIKIIFGIKTGERNQENVVFSKVDLDHLLNLSRQSEEESEPDHHNFRIFQNALDFSRVKTRECMIPRTEIEALDCNSNVEQLRNKFIETRLSRILIYEDSIDNIIGYYDLKDIFKRPSDIRSLIKDLTIVPETMPANKLLKMFVTDKMKIALVVDEFGGTSGIVTMEDVLEEIVGDIEDEHDINELTEKVISRNEFVLSGRLEIDYLNEKYNLHLPEKDDYETLAGMILFYYGSIPSNNDIIRVGDIVIKVLKATTTKLEIVNLKTSNN
jgi:CBS domain containing-hemolysin-like protein